MALNTLVMAVQTPESDSALCPDWVFSNNSNVHVAKDRGWFSDYTPFSSLVEQIYSDSTSRVSGVGTVKIKTKRSPGQNGIDSVATMTLKHVLHVPTYVCNIIGLPRDFLEDYDVTVDFGSAIKGTFFNSRDGRRVAYFDPEQRLCCLKLSGAPPGHRLGPHVWEKNTLYMINALWPDSEKERYMALQAQRSQTMASAAPLSEEEGIWLKRNYDSEYYFLREFGLSIYNEEHREVGRRIVRALMDHDGNPHNDEMDGNS